MDELFELIKALSPSEKRYFKRFAKQHSEDARPKYILLFDAYDTLVDFDPDVLKARIEDERILKYLNQEKKYLKDKLLECLRVYRGPRTIDGKLFRLLEEREILIELGLYKQGLKKLETAKKIALQYDKFNVLIQVLSLARKSFLVRNMGDSENIGTNEWNQIGKELNLALKSQENLAKYHEAYHAILLIYRKGSYVKPNQTNLKKKLDSWRESALFADMRLANSFSSLHLYHLSKSMLFQLEGQFDKASDMYEELIKMWEERPDRVSEEERQFMLVLSNYLNLQHKLGKYDKFDEVLKRIRSFSTENFDDQAENFQNMALLDLLYFMNRGIFFEGDKSDLLLESIQSRIVLGLQKYQAKINPARLLILYYNLMILNFLVGDIPQANYWLLTIDRSEYAKKIRREILDFCKVIQLIFFFDMDEFELILPFYRNNKRFLEREDRLGDFYLISMNLIHKLAGAAGKDAAKKLFVKNKELLNKEIQSTGIENIVGAREIMMWIRHKLEGKSLLELAREDMNNGADFL